MATPKMAIPIANKKMAILIAMANEWPFTADKASNC
jgi:hypothetical protein